MAKYTFSMEDVTGDKRALARVSYGYDWNFLADDETLLFGTTDETAFSVKNITPGTGISTGSGTLYKGSILRMGDVIETTIVIDITGLSSNIVGDIIGVAGGTANCHLGQITTARNGTILGGSMQCLETPATGEPDIDLYSATVATGAEDAAITDLTETALLNAGQDWIAGLSANQFNYAGLTTVPPANGYLYLSGGGGTTDAVYTAGKFVIKLYGYPS